MLLFPPSVRVLVAAEPTDMRRSFDRLAGMVREQLGEDPLSGHLFVFRNRDGDKLKILYWDRSGFCIWYKRLEQGTFYFPAARGGRVQITSADLCLLLEGIDLGDARRRLRYQRPADLH